MGRVGKKKRGILVLIKKILIIGACDAELILSRFRPEEISVIGKQEDIKWFWSSLDIDFAQRIKEVKVAVVVHGSDWESERIFKRLVRRGIPAILILQIKSKGADRCNLKNSYIKNLMEMGAKGVFYKDFVENPLAIEEFYRQVKKLAV